MEMCIRTSLYIAYVVSVERQNYYRSNSTKLLIYFPGNKNLHWRHVICFQFSQEIANQTVSKVIHENEKEKQGKQPLDSSMKIRAQEGCLQQHLFGCIGYDGRGFGHMNIGRPKHADKKRTI